MADDTMSREDHERAYGPGHYRGAQAAEVCSADIRMTREQYRELIGHMEEAMQSMPEQQEWRLFVDTTGEEPFISIWAGGEVVVGDDSTVAGVVFE